MGPLVERFGERIIIDSGLGRDARVSCIIDTQEWRWPLARSLGWIELARCTLVSFLLGDRRRDIVSGRMLLQVFSPFVMLGMRPPCSV
jgi:hypothetical protein